MSVELTGNLAFGYPGGVIVPLQPVTATASVGSVVQEVSIALSGVNASGSVGTMSIAARVLALTGVNATGSVGDVIAVYWKPIPDDQNPDWTNIGNSQTPGWVNVGDTQTPSWQNISNPQTPNWGNVSDEQTADWEAVVT
jgi:hypothetical protein